MFNLPWWWWGAPLGGVAALAFARRFSTQLLAAPPGDESMQQVAAYVREGAFAYLRQQYRIVALVFLALGLLLVWQAFGLKQQHGLVPLAFLTGGLLSALAGFIGMKTATLASSRTAEAARHSLNRSLQVSFRAGAVMGLTVVGLGLLHITLWFWLLAWLLPRVIPGFGMSLPEITAVMLCFGIGASVMALFARVGGGIFTKSADVGADLVGKTEAGIPEDDPRNPAVIADNVGDNVGDVAGMGADLFESYCGSILATAVLGSAAARALSRTEADQLSFVLAPMLLAGAGIAASVVGIYLVRDREGADEGNLLRALRRGVWSAAALILVAAGGICWALLPPSVWPGVFAAIATGLLAGVAIGWTSEYYTSADYGPTRWLAEQARTGPATTVIAGMAQGMLSSWSAIAVVGVATILAYSFAGGFHTPELGLYGIGIAAVGLLAPLGITLASDAFGSIADNAGGNAEMTHQPQEVRRRTDALDALGNTTAATGKGFAIGSAALTTLALLVAFVQEVRMGVERHAAAHLADRVPPSEQRIVAVSNGTFVQRSADSPAGGGARVFIPAGRGQPHVIIDGAARPAESAAEVQSDLPVVRLLPIDSAAIPDFMEFYQVNPMNPRFLVGVFLGVLLVFAFSGLTIRAVGRAAGQMVEEVRRQFRELQLLTDPGARADYASCVRIATVASLREMMVPALLAVAVPVAVGLLLNVGGVLGLLTGAVTSGFALAVFMANAGGAWDNAKKHIEAGHYGGKGSPAHKAAVVGDTLGDPLKDAAGPSLNILIKLMSMVAIVTVGVIVSYAHRIGALLGIGD